MINYVIVCGLILDGQETKNKEDILDLNGNSLGEVLKTEQRETLHILRLGSVIFQPKGP